MRTTLTTLTISNMELYAHQKEFLSEEHFRHLLCWDMGTGKTRTSIEWAKYRTGRTLAVVPKGLQENWLRESEKWGVTIDIISKENFKKLFRTIGSYDNLIIDEAHYFAGKSDMNKAMQFYCDANPHMAILALTGTPYLRNAWNVYRLGKILGHKWSYRTFDLTFFQPIRMGYRVIPQQKNDAATKKRLAQYVAEMGSTKHLSECADVPESQEYKEVVQVTKEQKEAVDELEDFDPLVRYMKEQQIMGGYIKADEFTPLQVFSSEKRKKLIELVGQNEKVMVVCRYIHEVEELSAAIQKEGRTVFTLHGGTKDRDKVVQKARKSEDCVLIVSAPMSEGWEIPEIETMIFYSHSFSLKDYLQMKGRVQRINDLRPRCYIHLIVQDSVDESVYKCMMNKKDFLQQIYAEKRSKTNKSI